MIRVGDIEVDRAKAIVRHGGVVMPLRNGGSNYRRKNLLCHMILAGPQTLEQLFEVLYGNDPGGGPISGTQIIKIMFKQAERHLTKARLRIVGEGRYRRGQRYWIEPIP